MKRVLLSLLLASSLAACATTAPSHGTMAGVAGHGRAVGTQGSTTARTNEGLALNARDPLERGGREVRGIPTPQPVREPSMSAHSIPVPQPPIPSPNFRGSAMGYYP